MLGMDPDPPDPRAPVGNETIPLMLATVMYGIYLLKKKKT